MHKEFTVNMPTTINEQLLAHLIRRDGQEDLCFGFWVPSNGLIRFTGVIGSIELPNRLDRKVHGNVSFSAEYFKRVCQMAIERNVGVAFMHSHPYPGWQSMSPDDVKAETKMAPTVHSLTNFPLIGLTVGNDGTWSARVWNHEGNGKFKREWATAVRVNGKNLSVNFNDDLVPVPEYRNHFRRTNTVYGKENHERVSRLRIGIVGVGSVGSVLCEILARMGFQNFTVIDFDVIKEHNLDRQIGATAKDLKRYKTSVAKRLIKTSGTSKQITVNEITSSVCTASGYSAALDCDVIYSCVDRPWPRHVLNHIAFAHLIPVIDGGIRVKFNKEEIFQSADWQVQTVTPGRPCLRCLHAYEPSDVDLERNGKLEDPSYMDGLPKDHYLKSNENIIPFSINLASLEVFQFISLTTAIGDTDFGVQRHRYIHGFISNYTDGKCDANCGFVDLTATADTVLKPI